jgi:polyisoprenoid-binding protein YceI
MARFQLVRGQSQLSLDGRSSLHPIHTASTELEGYLEVELDNGRLDLSVPPTGRFEVPVESLKAGNELYDLEMRRRLDTRRYPTIVAELLELRTLASGTRYQAVGDLTFHGVTRRYEGEVRITPLDEHTLEVSGERMFDVRDFNMEPPKLLIFKVYPEVQVMLKAVAKQADEC